VESYRRKRSRQEDGVEGRDKSKKRRKEEQRSGRIKEERKASLSLS
jgi:hypothetical protein